MSKFWTIMMACLLISLIAVSASANIYVDEDFEGASAFVDRNYPAYGTTIPCTVASVAVKGIHLRKLRDIDTSPSWTISTNGTITSERRFLGAQSLKLTSGQNITVPNTGYAYNRSQNKVHQFAVSFATETLPAAGTQVGHFKVDYTLTDTTIPYEVQRSIYTQFVVGASGKTVDVISSNTLTKVGSFFPGVGGWALLTQVVNNSRVDSAFKFFPGGISNPLIIFDPFTMKYKGPTTGGEPTTTSMYTIETGSHMWMNTTQTKTFVPASSIGSNWGSTTADGSPCSEVGWEIVAENGATMYIDNLYSDSAYHMTNVTGTLDDDNWLNLEENARILEFNTKTNEPAQTDVSAASTWELY